jgi:hypothetical protein
MSLATIHAAWDDFERAVKRSENGAWLEVLDALTSPGNDDEPRLALQRLRDLINGSIGYCVRDGWFGQPTLNGMPVKWVVAVLMEDGRPIGLRKIAEGKDGRKALSKYGAIREDVYGEVGGSLTQADTGKRATFHGGLVTEDSSWR